MPPRDFPDLSPAELEAFELLIVWYTRAGQIEQQIRAMEPNDERRLAVFEEIENG